MNSEWEASPAEKHDRICGMACELHRALLGRGLSGDAGVSLVIETFLHEEFRRGIFAHVADAILAADVLLSSIPEASVDMRNFFTDASLLLREIRGEAAPIPREAPALVTDCEALQALSQRLAELLMPFGLPASGANLFAIEDLLRDELRHGVWAELAMTVALTRSDARKLGSEKSRRVFTWLSFVRTTLENLAAPRAGSSFAEFGRPSQRPRVPARSATRNPTGQSTRSSHPLGGPQAA